MFFKKSQQGFSLLELMVVITIFLIITAVVMTDIPNFGRKGALDLTAQEVAGCIRAAQVYGTAERVVGESVNESIGVDFSKNDKIKIYASNDNDNKVIETCNLDGYSLAVDGVTQITFPSTDYTKVLNSNLEPTFVGQEDESINHIKITITSLRNNEQRCVYVFASGQITVGGCDE